MPNLKLGKPLSKAEVLPPSKNEADIVSILWDALMPKKYNGLLMARPYSDFGKVKSAWYFDSENIKYIHANGDILGDKQTRALFLKFKQAVNERQVSRPVKK